MTEPSRDALYEACNSALDRAGSRGNRRSCWVPGRIEIFGKHTDYAGGRSLLCALERGFAVRASPRQDRRVRVLDAIRGEERETLLDPQAEISMSDWGSYVTVVARRLARDFARTRRGMDLALASDLPPDAGLSSSSALVVSIALAVIDINELTADEDYQASITSREELAGYLGAVENGRSFGPFAGDHGVGTFGGSEDHTAILCCEAGSISQYSFAPVKHEAAVSLDSGLTFVVAVSGVGAAKAAGARERYNRLSMATVRLLELWNSFAAKSGGERKHTLADAINSSAGAVDQLKSLVGQVASDDHSQEDLRLRLEQFAEESDELVPGATQAFATRDYVRLGELANRSHTLAAEKLRNQLPETMDLQRSAYASGALAASAFGAGFGGSVWALVPQGEADEFARRWEREYRARHADAHRASRFFSSRPGGAAREW